MENVISKELEEKIAHANNLDEVVKMCNEAGIEITKEHLESAGKAEGELDAAELDDVSGGLFVIGGAVAAAAAAVIWRIYRSTRR